jgi:hypothetical protein
MVVRPTLQRAAARQGERGVRSMTAIQADAGGDGQQDGQRDGPRR